MILVAVPAHAQRTRRSWLTLLYAFVPSSRYVENMNQADTHAALQDYLARSNDYRVIALKGAWGTGKTHLWWSVAKTLSPADASPIYCSLFGKNSADEIKKALLNETLASISDGAAATQKFLSGLFDKAAKVADVFVKGADAVGQLTSGVFGQIAGAMLEKVIEGRLVVLDDFERRGRDLDIVAMLGLVDYLKNHECKVLFIFNEERLGESRDVEAFAQFREKLIDVELKLDITPEEAFNIAAEGRNVPYMEQTRGHFVALGVNNIRIASRVLKVVENVYRNNRQLDELLLRGTLRAAVTLTAVYFQGVPDAPAFDTLEQGTRGFGFLLAESLTDEQRRVRDFGAQHLGDADDGFVNILVRHLKTGAPLHNEFAAYWQQRGQRLTEAAERQRLTTWLTDVWWNPAATATDLTQRISALLPAAAERLGIDECQNVYDALIEIDAPHAEEFIRKASARIRERGTTEDIERADLTAHRGSQLSQHLVAAIEERGARLNPRPSLAAAVEKVGARNGYSALDAAVITEATTAQFIEVYRGATTGNMHTLMRFWEHLGEGDLAPAMPHVTAAVREVLAAEPTSRLARIISRVAHNIPVLSDALNAGAIDDRGAAAAT